MGRSCRGAGFLSSLGLALASTRGASSTSHRRLVRSRGGEAGPRRIARASGGRHVLGRGGCALGGLHGHREGRQPEGRGALARILQPRGLPEAARSAALQSPGTLRRVVAGLGSLSVSSDFGSVRGVRSLLGAREPQRAGGPRAPTRRAPRPSSGRPSSSSAGKSSRRRAARGGQLAGTSSPWGRSARARGALQPLAVGAPLSAMAIGPCAVHARVCQWRGGREHRHWGRKAVRSRPRPGGGGSEEARRTRRCRATHARPRALPRGGLASSCLGASSRSKALSLSTQSPRMSNMQIFSNNISDPSCAASRFSILSCICVPPAGGGGVARDSAVGF